MINHFANQSQTRQLLKILENIFFLTLKINCNSGVISGWTDIENTHRLSRGSQIYMYIYVQFLASHFNDLSPLYIKMHRVGNNRRTVNTSMTLHISDQLGTKNVCKTLLCWFIIMIRVLVCNNMYRYECHFGSFYQNPTISETVSVVSKWTNTENIFYWNTTTGNDSNTDGSLVRKMWKSNVKNIFHVGLSEWNQTTWYLRGVSWLRNHLPHMPAHSRQP